MNVSVYSRDAIEEIIKRGEFPENTAVISYYDTAERHFDGEYVPVDFDGVCSSDDIFYIELDDYDLEFIIRKGGTYESFFSDADALAEFIYKAYKNGKDFICQCEYGQSRSAGTAAAIMEHFYHSGIDIFSDYRYYPNRAVYHKVFDALGNLKAHSE